MRGGRGARLYLIGALGRKLGGEPSAPVYRWGTEAPPGGARTVEESWSKGTGIRVLSYTDGTVRFQLFLLLSYSAAFPHPTLHTTLPQEPVKGPTRAACEGLEGKIHVPLVTWEARRVSWDAVFPTWGRTQASRPCSIDQL